MDSYRYLFVFVLFLAHFSRSKVESYSNKFNRSFFDNFKDIFRVISNVPESNSFQEAIKENKLIGTEQAIIGPVRKNLDEARTCGQLIESRGLNYEIYYVTTSDGHILTGYHILHPKFFRNAKRPRPFLLLQGIFLSCAFWLLEPGPIESTAYYLADRGEDVWLINYQGTSYSRKHKYLNPELDPRFYDYSFYEIGTRNIPATVEYIKNATGYSKIRFLGHSMGTIDMLVHLSVTPSASNNYSIVFLSSPIAFLGGVAGIAQALPRSPLFLSLISSLMMPFPPFLPVTDSILTVLCTFFEPLCYEIIGQIFGSNLYQVDISRLSVFASEIDTLSVKTIVHLLQSIARDRISYFDYGKIMNNQLYGSDESPDFPFENIDPKNIVLLSSENDRLAPQSNVQKLRNLFKGRPLVDHIIDFPNWSHLDFNMANQNNVYLAEIVYNITQRYDPSDVTLK